MATEVLFLTREDQKVLQAMIDRVKRGIEGRPPTHPMTEQAWQEGEDHQAPEVYVAKVPADGIPALKGNVPGVKLCSIYRVVHDPGSTPSVQGVADHVEEVYNLSKVKVPTGFTLVWRDKYGQWFTVHSEGKGGSGEEWYSRIWDRLGTKHSHDEIIWINDKCKGWTFLEGGRAGLIEKDPAYDINCGMHNSQAPDEPFHVIMRGPYIDVDTDEIFYLFDENHTDEFDHERFRFVP